MLNATTGAFTNLAATKEWTVCTLSRFLTCDGPAPGLSSGNSTGGFMFHEIHNGASVTPRRVHRAALALALGAAFATVSWTSALNSQDHDQEQQTHTRGTDDHARSERDARGNRRTEHDASWRMIGRNSKDSRNQ